MTTTTHASDRTESEGPGNHAHHDADHGGHGGHADHVQMFRRLFWWSLLLTIPVVVTSPMVMDWFNYDLDFYGIEWIGPTLGSHPSSVRKRAVNSDQIRSSLHSFTSSSGAHCRYSRVIAGDRMLSNANPRSLRL